MRHIAFFKTIFPKILFFSNTPNMHALTFPSNHSFAGPTDNDLGRWNNHYDYGRSYSHTGRSYSDANLDLNSTWIHSAGFDNPYYDHPRS